HLRPAARAAASAARADRLRGRPGADLRRAGRPALDRPASDQGRRAGRAADRQPGGDARQVRALPQLGVPRERAVTAVTAGAAGAAAGSGQAAAGTARAGRWTRPALAALLAATALLYLVGLSRNGWANDFYAAAVQAGTRSWKAFFFGSFDSSNFITVDK